MAPISFLNAPLDFADQHHYYSMSIHTEVDYLIKNLKLFCSSYYLHCHQVM